MREHTSPVLLALESVLAGSVAEPPAGRSPNEQQQCSPTHGHGAGAAGPGGVLPLDPGLGVVGGGGLLLANGTTEEVVLSALDCLKEWARLGVSLGGLATDRPLLLDRVVRLLGGEGGPGAGGGGGGAAALPTACAACEVITELVRVGEYPRPAARAAAAEAILLEMGKLPALFSAAIQVGWMPLTGFGCLFFSNVLKAGKKGGGEKLRGDVRSVKAFRGYWTVMRE